jgi:hypothetical protein
LKFEEIGETAGVARDGQGHALAGMGIGLGDLNGDGAADLVVTNFFARSTVAFLAVAGQSERFIDGSTRSGLATHTRRTLGFGIALADFDADGRLDLIQANGHVLDRARLGVPFAMVPTLLRNSGERFEDVTSQTGGWFDRPILGRGLAVGDIDGDNRPDVVVNALDAPAALLRNTSQGGDALAVELVDRYGGPAVGALARVTTSGGRTLAGAVVAGGSYLCGSPRRLLFATGSARHFERIEVAWPWGRNEVWTKPPHSGDSCLRIKEGTGTPLP